MPLIPFPNVPLLPGVPDLNRLPLAIGVRTGVTQFLQSIDYFGLLPGEAPLWVVVDQQGVVRITPDSVADLSYRGENRVATYPVEEGGFASFNKTAVPQELTLRLTCGGKNMSRELFLQELKFLRSSLELVTVVTPDETLDSYNIDRVDYKRTNTNGVSLIIAEVHFVEVRVSASATYANTVEPSGNDPQSRGWVCTVDTTLAPTNQQTPLQEAVASVQSAFSSAQQSVSIIENTIRTQMTQVKSGVRSTLETAGVGTFT
ncbi:phage baseplate protein [Paraburkholderia tuberum]|uniref:Dit-like phage tail protein N-terminal domain-containing protein n=1 Tax=Paraburkholderia tuberum TaxID=157910 RepID=A0A1H1GYB2_9BURK|nr:hypothetical protein [Paraburkholderia tuberum]SDR17796.1 hypothetical protein SAMN05445850_3138 [Paraburkholderia tuberum]